MFQNLISLSEKNFALGHKERMSAERKTIEEMQTILLESMQRLR